MAETDEKREPTRRDLAETLAKASAVIESQAAAITELRTELQAVKDTPANALLQKELQGALAEVRELRQSKAPLGPAPKLVPYKGLVRAIEPCVYGHKRETGEVFEVSVPALWSDDPYEPVALKGVDRDGQAIVEPIDAVRVNFQFRKVVSAASDPTPRRASEY